jgi:hypothetical protein
VANRTRQSAARVQRYGAAGLSGYLVSGPVTGGTGRFAGATGFLVWRGTVDPVALTFSDVVTGWISAPGEDDRDD